MKMKRTRMRKLAHEGKMHPLCAEAYLNVLKNNIGKYLILDGAYQKVLDITLSDERSLKQVKIVTDKDVMYTSYEEFLLLNFSVVI